MNKQKYIRKMLYCISLLLLLVSFVLDVLILNRRIDPFFSVRNDYIPSIFSGILTFSTLSLTVLSIIVSVIDTTNYGLKLRDIVSFNASPIKFTHYIFFTTLLTFSSVIALAFELCTFISIIATISIFYTNYTSIEVFRIISEKETCRKIVFSEIENKNHRILDKHIVSWINEYKNAIIRNYKPEINMYAEILQKCTDYVDTSIFENYLQDLFETACKYHSVSDAIFLSFDSIGLSSRMIDVCKESIQAIRYYDEFEIVKLDLPTAVESIITSKRIMGHHKVKLAYYYFNAIIYGKMSQKEKIELLDAMINKITKITEDECGMVKSGLIYRIVFQNIICEDSVISEILYDTLMRSLYCNNLNSNNRTLVATMARIFRSIYFYSTLAVTLIDETKRNQIAKMGRNPIMLDYLNDVSIKNWIIRFREEFLFFYIQDAFELEDVVLEDMDTIEQRIRIGEHCMLWYGDNKLRFAFWYYFACCATSDCFPLRECMEGIKNVRDFHWKSCTCLLSEFGNNGSALTDQARFYIESLKALNSDNTSLFVFPDQLRNTYDIIKSVVEENEVRRD